MDEVVFTSLVVIAGAAAVAVIHRYFPQEMSQILWVGFAAHVFASFAQIWVYYYYYGAGDLCGYLEVGARYAGALRSNWDFFFPRLVAAFFQQEGAIAELDFTVEGSTATTLSLSSFVLWALGDSFYASSALIGILSLISKLLIYYSISPELPPTWRRPALVAFTLVPSAVFWTATLLKEPLAMIALGPLVLATSWLANGRRFWLALLILIVCGTLLFLVKPYIIACYSIASAAWIASKRVRPGSAISFKPANLILGAAIASSGLIVVARASERFSVERVSESTAAQRRSAEKGGSDYQLEDPSERDQEESRPMYRELLLVPLALATALFRPLLFEARNAMQLLNGIEATVFLILFVRVIRRKNWRLAYRTILQIPSLQFAAIFVVSLAIGTALSSSNLGTLSRYRAPMIPFFCMLLLILSPQRLVIHVPQQR